MVALGFLQLVLRFGNILFFNGRCSLSQAWGKGSWLITEAFGQSFYGIKKNTFTWENSIM